jgi:hypothetical protein
MDVKALTVARLVPYLPSGQQVRLAKEYLLAGAFISSRNHTVTSCYHGALNSLTLFILPPLGPVGPNK